MIINDNLMSLFAANNLQNTQNDLQKVLQQLSSGLRINSAADDAAGLAIAQKMEAQINGLDQAKRNAQDAISLVQTAGGALTEIQSMLQRMRELAVQAASDTQTTQDRQQLQNEVDQLTQEIQQIATTAQFNTQKLLNGNFSNRVFQVGANAGETLNLSIGTMTAGALQVVGNGAVTLGSGLGTVTVSSGTLADGTYSLEVSWDSGTSTYTFTLLDATGSTVATGTASDTSTTVNLTTTGTTVSITLDTTSTITDFADALGTSMGTTGVQVGSLTVVDGKFTQSIMSAGLASTAIQTIDNAIQQVSAQQALLGAYQNRLQHVTNVNAIAYENLTSAKAQIMDVDMASAMAQFTRDQILQQAGIAALAQANQVPAAVLKLLG